jgi:hypothetical protein
VDILLNLQSWSSLNVFSPANGNKFTTGHLK